MALGWHSHPYAITFAGCTGLFYLFQWRREKSRVPSAVLYGLCLWPDCGALDHLDDKLCCKFLPIWSRKISRGQGTEPAWSSLMGFVWIRLYNLFYMI